MTDLRDVFQLFFCDFKVGSLIDLVLLDDIVRAYFLGSLCIDLRLPNSIPGFLFDLIETDLFSIRSGGKNATKDSRKKPFQFARGGAIRYSYSGKIPI